MNGNWYVPVNQTDQDLLSKSRRTEKSSCQNKAGQHGICMFAQKCVKEGGINLGICKNGFYFGSCCQLPIVDEMKKTVITTSENTNARTTNDGTVVTVIPNPNKTQLASPKETMSSSAITSSTMNTKTSSKTPQTTKATTTTMTTMATISTTTPTTT